MYYVNMILEQQMDTLSFQQLDTFHNNVTFNNMYAYMYVCVGIT